MTKENFLILIRYIWDHVLIHMHNSPFPVQKKQSLFMSEALSIFNILDKKKNPFTAFSKIQSFIIMLDSLIDSLLNNFSQTDPVNPILNLKNYITLTLTLGFGSRFFQVGDRVRFYNPDTSKITKGCIEEIPEQSFNLVIRLSDNNAEKTYSIPTWAVFKLDEDQQEVPK